MSLVKNRATLYAIMRRDVDRDVVCCFCKTADKAERLANEYEQDWKDHGGDIGEVYFYAIANIYYDE